MWAAILLGTLYLIAGGIATFVLYRRDLVDGATKRRQLLVIWLLPLIGAGISLLVALAPEDNTRSKPRDSAEHADTSAAIADTYDTIRHDDHTSHADGHITGGHGS